MEVLLRDTEPKSHPASDEPGILGSRDVDGYATTFIGPDEGQ